MMLVSLVVGAALSALGNWYGCVFGGWEVVLYCVNVLVSLAMSTTLFAMIYKFTPRARIAWSDVWIGAAVTAVLFEAGKFLIGFYLGKAGVTSGFGAAGSFVVLIIWVYYSAQIFLLGAEFTWVYARAHGTHSAVVAGTESSRGNCHTGEKSGAIPTRGAESPVPVTARPR